MKKIIPVILVLTTMLIVGLTSCGGKTAGGKQKVTIWAWDPKFNVAIMEEAKTRFGASNPNVEFEIVDMAKADVEQKLLINLSSGVTDGLPDIVLIEDYNAQKYISSYPDGFADLTGKIDYKNFAPYKVKLMTVGGKTYGVPFDSGVAGTFYRKDLLEASGFKASDMENITWDRFIEIGNAVKEKTGVAMCAFDPTDGGLVRIMLQSAGSWYFDKDGKPNLAGNPVMEKAVATYAKLINSPGCMKTTGWAEWVGSINSGKAASISTGVWIIGSVKAEASQAGKWAVAPIPRLDVAGSVNASNLGGSSWYVLKASKSKDTAIKFLNEIYAKDNDFYQKILINQGAVGSFLPSQSGEAYTKADDFFGGQTVFTEFSKYMKAIPAVEYGSYTYEADAAIAAILPSVYEGTSVPDALAKAQEQLASAIK